MQKRGGKSLHLGLWLALRVGPEEAGRLIRRARGGDASARSQLESWMVEFLRDPALAAAIMDDAGLLDVELAPTRDPTNKDESDWKPLRLELPVGKRGRGRPPIRRIAQLITTLVAGRPKQGRSTTGGGLRAPIEAYRRPNRPTVREVLRNLIKDWRAGAGIPELSDDEQQTLRPFFSSIVGMRDDYIGPPPDFMAAASGGTQPQPAYLQRTVHEVLWRAIARPDPPTRSADGLIGELVGKSPDAARRAAGTGNRTKSGAIVRRAHLEKSGIRVLLEAPGEFDEVEWDQALETASHVVRRYNTWAYFSEPWRASTRVWLCRGRRLRGSGLPEWTAGG